MSDENENENEGNPSATDQEIADLIKAQATRIGELEAENKGVSELKSQVEQLQSTLGTQSSLTELVAQLKAMNTNQQPSTPREKAMDALTKAAESGDMKMFRKLREDQMEANKPRGMKGHG